MTEPQMRLWWWGRIELSEGKDPCWLWLGPRHRNGYGKAKWRGRTWRAHRLSWELFREPVPRGLQVCHRCDVRHCTNPEHLFVGTAKDNAQDREAKGRGRKPRKRRLVRRWRTERSNVAGVTWQKHDKVWQVHARVPGQRAKHYVGVFARLEAARRCGQAALSAVYL